MPIKDKSKYPKDWRKIVERLKIKAGNKCELCEAENGKPHWKTESKVVLTVHHCEYLPDTIKNNSYPNLIVLCQRCHLRLDLSRHTRKKDQTLFENIPIHKGNIEDAVAVVSENKKEAIIVLKAPVQFIKFHTKVSCGG